jgi:hypothetical protein
MRFCFSPELLVPCQLLLDNGQLSRLALGHQQLIVQAVKLPRGAALQLAGKIFLVTL